VRLVGPEGISAPVGITIHLAEPLPDAGAEAGLPLQLLAGGLLVLLGAASVFFWRRNASS
jgi:LPXTG-motif cell wall-anchored protein